jgi:hypothetical protein
MTITRGNTMTCRNERGTGLVIAILTIVALFALGSALAFLTRTDVNIAKHQTLHTEAIYVAEGGVEEALYRLSLRDPTNVTVNGSTINAAIRDDSIPYDPNWKARIFLTRPGAEPVAASGEDHTVTVQDAGTWLEYSDASDPNIALTIEHKWKDLDDDGLREDGEIVLYDVGQYPPENHTSGSPVEVITVPGKSAMAARDVLVEAVRFPLNINARAALFCNEGVDVRGNVTVCGHDHDIDTPIFTMLPGCRAWELNSNRTRCTPTGCLVGVMTTGDIVDTRGTTDLAGEPAPIDTSSSNQFYTLAEFLGITQTELDEILAGADFRDVGVTDPQDGITYVDNAGLPDAKWNGGTGTGLLYVTGNLDVSGNIVYKGLIYIEGDFTITGTPWVLGAVIVKGVSSYAFSGGNPAILYSSEAIAYFIQQHLDYIRIGWKETSGL